jgi:hypothetical protein
MDQLTPSAKTKLHQVSAGMLEIYRTLVRMRYLDASWIHEGPHNVDALLPMYQSYKLDPAVIYLYSILPYVDTGGAASVDFFQGGEFADFRLKEHVERGRDPFYTESDSESMRPWMTPLSLLGNHQTVIIYDTKRHRIGMFDQESGRSTDRNPMGGDVEDKDETEEEVEEADSNEEENEGDDADDDDDDDDDEWEDEEDDEDEENENIYDEMVSRPAVAVLRDIVKWYNELLETPGGGEQSASEWEPKMLVPLYRKNGWPSDSFDGDNFLVDMVRAKAADQAKYDAEEPMRKVRENRGSIQDEGSASVKYLQGELAKAKTPDQEWKIHWHMWRLQRRNEWGREALIKAEARMARMYPDGQCLKPEDLPLWELWKLRQELSSAQNSVKDSAGRPAQLRYAEQQAALYQKAYDASRLDAERLCPGRVDSFSPLVNDPPAEDPEEREKDRIERLRQNIEEIRDWIAQLPESATETRKDAQYELANCIYGYEQFLKFQGGGQAPKP